MYVGVKVFAATRPDEVNNLGTAVTEWLRSHPELLVTNTEVTQSSAERFHCLTITLMYIPIKNQNQKETDHEDNTNVKQTTSSEGVVKVNRAMGKRKP